MMDCLTDVLSSTEKIEIDEINLKIPKLKLLVESSKAELVQYTDNVYIKYSNLGRPKQNRKLLSTVQNLEEEIISLNRNAAITKRELVKASEKIVEYVETLDAIDFTFHVLSTISKINEKLVELTSCLNESEFLQCKKNIDFIRCIINKIPEDEKLMVIDQLKSTLEEKNNLLLNKIRQCFQDKVITTKKENLTSLKIICHFHPLDQALLAMFHNESVVYTLSEFAKFLWDNFFVPIVDNVVSVEIDKNSDFSLIKLEIIDTTEKSSYKTIFSNLKIVLDFLKMYFNFPLTEIEPIITSVEYIGKDIRDNLSELIIKHCLVDTIPSTVEELKQYKVVIEDTEKLEAALRESKIFVTDTASLLEYANNIDFHFINKKCEEHLINSQQIMKKDLHDMMEIGVPYNPDNPMGSDLEEFLQCSISKSAKELLNYCEQILQQAVKGSDISAGRLLTTCQNILRKYITFVPDYHSKMLKTIPQQVALFHNNCVYISHTIKYWYKNYVSVMPSTLNLTSDIFDEEVSMLRQVGSETFSAYVNGQIKQINEIMKDGGLDDALLEGDLKPITEKSVRQCLRQQELLKTVWHKVLSYRVYNESIGLILNSLCACLINPIINFEDISSNSAEQLVEVIKIIISRGPKLFTDPKEVSLYVKLWYKLNELNFVLSSSLVDINDRWADGKGPLAIQFKPTELKSLIRALFQNTDRRAAILVKIQ